MTREEAHQNAPHLSIVVASRNDDHGGSLTERSNAFLASLADQIRRLDLDAEVVLVEWNPPIDRPSLTEALDWSAFAGLPVKPRVIRVPPEVHRNFPHSRHLPLYQMIAKNVGIRRSRGRFILATNIDILFSDSLMAWLAERPLREDCYYRVDRYDVPTVAPATPNPGDRDSWYAANAIRVARRDGIYARPPDRPNAAFERIAVRSPARAMSQFYREVAGGGDGTPGDRLRAVVAVTRKVAQVISRRWQQPPHTNASGDFTLMHRDHWFGLGGYAEFPGYSWHLDGLLIQQARHRGLREEALLPPRCIYHVEHAGGWSPEGHQELFDRLAESGIPYMTSRDLWVHTETIRRSPRDMRFNSDDWGLALHDLEEKTPS